MKKEFIYMSLFENTELLKESHQFFTAYEPKTVTMFLVKITNKEGKTIIPPYLIKEITLPKVQWQETFKSWLWLPIVIRTYNPIVPSATQMFYDYILEKSPNPFDIIVDVLGPVGDTVEKWEIKNAKFSQINFGDLNWENYSDDHKSKVEHLNCTQYHKGGNPSEITAVITYENAHLIF